MLPHGIQGKTMKLRSVANDGAVTEFDIQAQDLGHEHGMLRWRWSWSLGLLRSLVRQTVYSLGTLGYARRRRSDGTFEAMTVA